jgi:tetratricopeptide (TPR) repeat protein
MGSMLSSMVHAELGWAALIAGDLETARGLFQTGIDGTSATKYLEAPALWVGQALAYLASGDHARAGSLVDEATGFVDDRAMAFLRPLIALGRGSVAAAAGDAKAAADLFGEGADLASAMSIGSAEWQLRAAQAGAMRSLGRQDEAEAAIEAARRVVDEMASRFADPSLGESFGSSARARLDALAGTPAA